MPIHETEKTNGRAEEAEILERQETRDLIEAYYRLPEQPRRRLLELARSLKGAGQEVGAPASPAKADLVAERPDDRVSGAVTTVKVIGLDKPTAGVD